MITKNFMNTKQAAEFLGLSVSHLRKLKSLGKIPFYRPFGKNIYYDRLELEQLIRDSRQGGPVVKMKKEG